MVVDGSIHPATAHAGPVYQFSVDLQKITWTPLSSDCCNANSDCVLGKRHLKITVLYGSEQREIGSFEIFSDECIVDELLRCRMPCSKPEDFGKLHVYIDEALSSGLAGHIAVDLKEFSNERDCKVHVEYPLYAANSLSGSRVPKFKMTVQCDFFGHEECTLSPECENVIQWSPKDCRAPIQDEACHSGHTSETDIGSPHRMLVQTLDSCVEEVDIVCEQRSQEVQLLKNVESILFELNAKLTNVVAPYKVEDNLLGDLPMQIKDTANQCSWLKHDLAPTQMWDPCNETEAGQCQQPYGSSYRKGQGIDRAYQAESRHTQARERAECFLCSKDAGRKYEALFSCFSSGHSCDEGAVTAEFDSIAEGALSVEVDNSTAIPNQICPRSQQLSSMFHTIVGVVLLVGASVLGWRKGLLVGRKDKKWSIGFRLRSRIKEGT